MWRTVCWLAIASFLVGACDGDIDIDWNQIISEVADQLRPPAGAGDGPASVLQFSNISVENLTGTVEVFYTLDDGTTSRELAVIEVPSDYLAPFDIGCPSSIRFAGKLGSIDFSLSVTRGVDYECGRILEFAASPGVVQFVNSPMP